MHALRLVVFGPGRAGGSIALAAERAGHRVVGLVPGPTGTVRTELLHLPVSGEQLPGCDLLVVAVPDDALPEVVARLEGTTASISVVAHLSGFTSHEVLAPLRREGTAIGSLHPVQSLPDPATGSEALRGASAAVSGERRAVTLLASFATSLGMIPFELDDADRALHHAAATAASNFVAVALIVAVRLAERAGTPVEAYAALTRTTVANVATHGAAALTGPVARGDLGTLRGHLDAIAGGAPDVLAAFVDLVAANASMTPHREAVESLVGEYR